MPEIAAAAIVEQADLEPFDADELADAPVVDAFLILRYQHPDWPTPRCAYSGTRGMSDELRIGLLTMVTDRMRHTAIDGWADD